MNKRQVQTDGPEGHVHAARVQSGSVLVGLFGTGHIEVTLSLLHLHKKEEGQGLVHLASGTAAFRLQFAQKCLTAPEDLTRRPVAYEIRRTLGGLGFGQFFAFNGFSKIILVDYLFFFIKVFFKVWDLFKVKGALSLGGAS